jgi:16S rRNA (uracil1498-N3)-methyltransferase
VHAALAEPGALRPGLRWTLDPEESRHLRVRRARAGEPVRLFDGAGVVASARLEETRDGFAALIETVEIVPAPPVLRLLVGAGDKERFGWLAEKAAELGVTDLVPLVTERTRSVASGIRAAHVRALERRARQGIKQSRSPWAPRIHPPCEVEAAAGEAAPGERWIADPRGEPPLPIAPEAALSVAVGPEGGFTEAERRRFHGAGFVPVRLAPDLLRFETAALAAAAVVATRRPRRSHE